MEVGSSYISHVICVGREKSQKLKWESKRELVLPHHKIASEVAQRIQEQLCKVPVCCALPFARLLDRGEAKLDQDSPVRELFF